MALGASPGAADRRWRWNEHRGGVVAAARGEPFPYVPAILAGALLALVFGP